MTDNTQNSILCGQSWTYSRSGKSYSVTFVDPVIVRIDHPSWHLRSWERNSFLESFEQVKP